jgi:hypothetical protein
MFFSPGAQCPKCNSYYSTSIKERPSKGNAEWWVCSNCSLWIRPVKVDVPPVDNTTYVLVWITEGAETYAAAVTPEVAAERGYQRQVLPGLTKP